MLIRVEPLPQSWVYREDAKQQLPFKMVLQVYWLEIQTLHMCINGWQVLISQVW